MPLKSKKKSLKRSGRKYGHYENLMNFDEPIDLSDLWFDEPPVEYPDFEPEELRDLTHEWTEIEDEVESHDETNIEEAN